MEIPELIDAWHATINGPEKSCVLFANGTCVILMQPEADLATRATALLREFGPVHAGTSSSDFNTVTLENGRGWVVTCQYNDILTYVGPDEAPPNAEDWVVGIRGRSKRGQDAENLRVIHVEDHGHTERISPP